MKIERHGRVTLHDFAPRGADFLADVLDGLSAPPGQRRLPSKYFYDEQGSLLFERITQLPEYYLTRTELAILRGNLPDIAALLGPRIAVLEPGSGSGEKTRLLLRELDDPAAYIPVDISREILLASALQLADDFPQLAVLPVCADYFGDWRLPPLPRPARRCVAYFPGSTIGNMEPDEAAAFLARLRELTGPDGGVLIGVDLQKDPAVIAPAYADAQGVTAAFNLNLVARMNRELGAGVPEGALRHYTAYNESIGRNESYLEATRDFSIELGGRSFSFAAGERIGVEHSYKFTLAGFAALAARAGLAVARVWTDPQQWFSVQYLAPA